MVMYNIKEVLIFFYLLRNCSMATFASTGNLYLACEQAHIKGLGSTCVLWLSLLTCSSSLMYATYSNMNDNNSFIYPLHCYKVIT